MKRPSVYFLASYLTIVLAHQNFAKVSEVSQDNIIPATINQNDSSPEELQATLVPAAKPLTIPNICSTLSKDIKREIQGYQSTANLIIQTVINGAFKGRTYKELAYFLDKFGSRLTGTDNLEHSIDYMLNKMKNDELDNVHGEAVIMPFWERGEEKATLILPRKKNLAILGLGNSVGTPAEGITAPVLVVRNFDELEQRAAEVNGKIVVYNEVFQGYAQTIPYREDGPNRAAKYGAVAALVRSITTFSINTPHTGPTTYKEGVNKIPAACITLEDAELLQRLQNYGEEIVINLKLNETTYINPKMSRNSVAEIKGREKPDHVVVISGHIDSWDVGQGAMDDGGGVFISAEALALLRYLNLKPRRTIRTILWTAEENGKIGVQQYLNEHRKDIDKFNAVFESDSGTFKPLGLDFAGTPAAGCIVQEVLKLLEPINATTFRALPSVGTDITYFIKEKVPGLSLNNDNDRYYWFHHSEGDTLTVQDADELDLCTAVWAVASYVLADLSIDLPR